MTRRTLVFLAFLLFLSIPLLADLIPGAARALDQPEFRPWPTYSGVELTENDGVFLASWSQNEAVRLDRDGDALDRPPLQLGVVPYGGLGVRSDDAVPDGDGWIIPTRAYPNQTTSALVFQRLAADGTISRVGEVAIPRSFGTLDVEGSDGSFAILFSIDAVKGGIITFDSWIRASAPLILDGISIGLAAGNGTFAVLFRDRVVILSPEPAVLRSVPVPQAPGWEPLGIVPWENGFAVALSTGTAIVVYRIGEVATEVASIPAPPRDDAHFAFDSSGAALLLAWRAGPPTELRSPLVVARVTGAGFVEGPITIGAPAMYSEVEGDNDGWLVAWTDSGPDEEGILRTRRVDEDEPLGAIADDVDPIVWGVPPENAQAIAVSGDAAMALWFRSGDPGDRGAVFDRQGRRTSPHFIVPFYGAARAAGGDGGFLVYGVVPSSAGGSALLAWRVSLDGVLDPAPILLAEGAISRAVIECGPEVCLAAWREDAVRVARIRGSQVLDPGGVPVYFPTNPVGGLAAATDGSKFLVGWSRTKDGGTIVTAALIDPRQSLHFEVMDVLAVNEVGHDPLIEWNGTTYDLVLSGAPFRITRVRPDGSVVEGEESGWAGWPVEIEGVSAAAFAACGRTYFATFWPGFGLSSHIYEIEERGARLHATVPLRIDDVACFDGRSCIAIADEVLSPRWPPGTSAFVLPMTCTRERVLGR